MAGVDLDLLPPLSVVKQVSQQEILAEMESVAGLEGVGPHDPAYRPLLAGSYREALLRQDADEQARGLSLATTSGVMLDHIGVTYYRGVDGKPIERLPGESDVDYKARLHDSPSGLSVAGPVDAYEFHARSAHPNIKAAKCTSPSPAQVTLYLLGREGEGEVSEAQCRLVEAYLWDRRPLTDHVRAESATIIRYSVRAKLYLSRSPDPEGVIERAVNATRSLAALQHKLKGRVVLSSLHACMRVPSVEDVVVEGWSDVVCKVNEAPFCTELVVEFGGWIDELDEEGRG